MVDVKKLSVTQHNKKAMLTVEMLLRSVEEWNQARKANPGEKVNLSGANLYEADLYKADLSGADLSGANLSEANLDEADLSRANLIKATLNKANLSGATLYEADLSMAHLIEVNLIEAKLNKGNLSRANLYKAYLGKANLSDANLRGADLNKADLDKADLRGANLSGADLDEAKLNKTNLSGANLYEAYLGKVDLSGANLSKANLCGATLYKADLNRSHLDGADLSKTDLHRANLSEADLSGADLSGSDLSGADLSRTDLIGADLSRATLYNTVFADVNLSDVKGLDTVNHQGPSTIGVDTLYNSKGNIPEVFLKGCGLPDTFIEYAHSLTSKAIEFYSCFISYSTADKVFADRLYADLQAKGVRCWYAPHDMKGGKKIHDQIGEAIRQHEKLLLILSERSINSEWVKQEITKAKKREDAEGKRVLFPIGLIEYSKIQEWEFPDSKGRDLAEEIRMYYIPSFIGWDKDNEAYTTEFGKLLNSFQADRDTEGKV